MQRDMAPSLCIHLIALFRKECWKTPIVKVRVTLRLAVYSPSVRLGAKPPKLTIRDCFFATEPLRSWSLYNIISGEDGVVFYEYTSPLSSVRIGHIACSAPAAFYIVLNSTTRTPRKGWCNSKAVDLSVRMSTRTPATVIEVECIVVRLILLGKIPC
jgi:hypothetical protein